MECIMVEKKPKVEEYNRLRRAVGWPLYSDEAVKTGLSNSIFSVCAVVNGEVIGFGRVVGDGGIYFYIQDVMVLPEFQKKGIGRRILDAVTKYIDMNAYPGSFVGLMAAKGVSELYRKYGFSERPPESPGMFRIIGR